MAITGYQFDKAKVTALHDSILYHWLANKQNFILDDIGSEMAVTTDGLSATVDSGAAIVCGRMVEITSPETVEIPANSRGYLVIYIDLSAENTATGVPGESSYEVQNNQVSVRFVTNLTQQDMFQGGLIYTFNLGTIETNTSSVVRFVSSDSVKKPAQLHKLSEDDGKTIRAYDTDVNTHTTAGTRWINPKCANSPFPTNYGFIETYTASSDVFQIAREWYGSWRVFRRSAGGASLTWTSWTEITPVDPHLSNLENTGWKSAGYAGTYYKRSGDMLSIKFWFTGNGSTLKIGTIPLSVWRPPQDHVIAVPQFSDGNAANTRLKIYKDNGSLNVVGAPSGALYRGQVVIMI